MKKSIAFSFCSEVHFRVAHRNLLEIDWEDDFLGLLHFSFSICFKYPVPARPSPIQHENTC